MIARTRFAPSPSGFLHLGNARTALFAYLFAKKNKGRFVLRIEDTDLERIIPESERSIMEDLKWLGLNWDEGPDNGGPVGPYRCSERMHLYESELKKLQKTARVYRCFCTTDQLEQDRALLSSQKKVIKYVGRCLHLSDEESKKRAERLEPFVWRLHVPEGPEIKIQDLIRDEVTMQREVLGDFVLCRSNGVPVFLFANAVDDALQEMTHVIRGEDHLSNTFRQVIILQMFGYPVPTYAHLPMIGAEDGGKLSKRAGSLSIRQLREDGFIPTGLLNYLSLLGWSPGDTAKTGEKFTKADLENLFDLRRVSKGRALFDFDKLRFLNHAHMTDLTNDQLAELAPCRHDEWKSIWTEAIQLVRNDAYVATELYRIEEFLKRPNYGESESAKRVLVNENAQAAIRKGEELFAERVKSSQEPVEKVLQESIKEVGKALGLKGKDLYFPFRVAITGVDAGPELLPLVKLLGKLHGAEEISARMNGALEFAKHLKAA